jgi:hypothetical protein
MYSTDGDTTRLTFNTKSTIPDLSSLVMLYAASGEV